MQTTMLLLTAVLGILWISRSPTEAQVPYEWPCPLAEDITPCVCTTDADLEIFLDCSDVTSTDMLQGIFASAIFPFTDLNTLTIKPAGDPHGQLSVLPAGVFGQISFQNIHISNTFIHTIEEETFVNSHSKLVVLDIPNNAIEDFPFETLELFTVLLEFNMANNKLLVLPDLVSETVRSISLKGNIGLKITTTTFEGTHNLEEVYLNEMGLVTTNDDTTDIPANVFDQNKYISIIVLNNNNIINELEENFINPPVDTITLLNLDSNQITNIHPLSITGLSSTAQVYLRDNDIETLDKDNWAPLLEQVTQKDAIDIRENPLTCGCDVYWLVVDTDLMNKIHAETTCQTGNFISTLDLVWFTQHCPDGP